MEDFLATVLPRPADTGAGQLPPKILLHSEKQKYFTLTIYFAPQTSKPGYGPDSAKIVSAIRIFCYEGDSASRLA